MMHIALRKEKAEAALRERIRQRISILRNEPTLIYGQDATDLPGQDGAETGPGEPATPGLLHFHNLYKGQRCFIIGDGASINRHDLSLLAGEKVFAANAFHGISRETGFRPTFFVVDDEAVLLNDDSEIMALDVPFKFLPVAFKAHHPAASNMLFFRMDRGFDQVSSRSYGLPRFSPDPVDGLCSGQSAVYVNLQLAFFMGFSEVYLLGMDYEPPPAAEAKPIGTVLLPGATPEPTTQAPAPGAILTHLRLAKLSFEAVGRKIYNASVGSSMTLFDGVDFAALLCDPKTGLKRETAIEPAITFPAAGAAKAGDDAPELVQLRQNFKALDAHARRLEGLARSGGAVVSLTAQSGDLLQRLSAVEVTPATAVALVRSCASALLLDPKQAMARMQPGSSLSTAVDRALALLPKGDPLAEHFQRVRSYAATRSGK